MLMATYVQLDNRGRYVPLSSSFLHYHSLGTEYLYPATNKVPTANLKLVPSWQLQQLEPVPAPKPKLLTHTQPCSNPTTSNPRPNQTPSKHPTTTSSRAPIPTSILSVLEPRPASQPHPCLSSCIARRLTATSLVRSSHVPRNRGELPPEDIKLPPRRRAPPTLKANTACARNRQREELSLQTAPARSPHLKTITMAGIKADSPAPREKLEGGQGSRTWGGLLDFS